MWWRRREEGKKGGAEAAAAAAAAPVEPAPNSPEALRAVAAMVQRLFPGRDAQIVLGEMTPEARVQDLGSGVQGNGSAPDPGQAVPPEVVAAIRAASAQARQTMESEIARGAPPRAPVEQLMRAATRDRQEDRNAPTRLGMEALPSPGLTHGERDGAARRLYAVELAAVYMQQRCCCYPPQPDEVVRLAGMIDRFLAGPQ